MKIMMNQIKQQNPIIAASFVILLIVVGSIGGIATAPNIPTWYANLSKPSFTPPSWVFGPVWTVLYGLMGYSVYRIFRLGWKKKHVSIALVLFGTQLVLNIAWSFLFFGLQSPILGLIDITMLFVAIAITIERFYRLDQTAAYLLVPYILWVSFAGILNATLYILN